MGHYFVKIRTDSWERLRDLQAVHKLDVFGRTAKQPGPTEFEIEGLLSEEEVERTRAAGYSVEIQADADRVAAERSQEISRNPPEPPP
jgi:hypothetical protein